MTTNSWQWKGKDGGRGGLLYESGNWGDQLKMLWLAAVLRWKKARGGVVNYFDPFAGDVHYPLGRKTCFRFEQMRLSALDFIKPMFIDRGLWPSSASAARQLVDGRAEVFDADPDRRANWENTTGITVLAGESGWELLERRPLDSDGLWLLDPYDFIAEWRHVLPLIVAAAKTTSILLYIYNRSARSDEAFREYRAFRNALEDTRGQTPKRLGRVAADAFLPRAHHEMLFLPGAADAGVDSIIMLFDELGECTVRLDEALRRSAVFDT